MCKQCGLPTGAGEDYDRVDENPSRDDVDFIEYMVCDSCGARGKLVAFENARANKTGRYFEEPEVMV